MSFFQRERSSLTVLLYAIIDMRENLLVLTLKLSSRHLPQDEISLLSKGLKFVPTRKHINKAKIKEGIEVYGRKLRLMWHFCNDDREFEIELEIEF